MKKKPNELVSFTDAEMHQSLLEFAQQLFESCDLLYTDKQYKQIIINHMVTGMILTLLNDTWPNANPNTKHAVDTFMKWMNAKKKDKTELGIS